MQLEKDVESVCVFRQVFSSSGNLADRVNIAAFVQTLALVHTYEKITETVY
jgi:hypothetical protein